VERLVSPTARDITEQSSLRPTPSDADYIWVRKEDWLRLVEDRFANAFVADVVASELGARAERVVQAASTFADHYLSFVRPIARKYASAVIECGSWSLYADFLPYLLELHPPVRVTRRRGRPPEIPPREILTALRKYDEIMLVLRMPKPRKSVIQRYAPDLSDQEVAELTNEKDHLIAAKLAVRGTGIKWKTLLHNYAQKYKTGRLHSITNDLGYWDRHGKRRRAFRWKRIGGPEGEEEVLEPIS
jgi:hypothetical protein